MTFTCNVCGFQNQYGGQALDRERPSCSHCQSNVRMRSIVQALSMELFGVSLLLPHFPRVKSLRGLGFSDANQYAERLAGLLDYRNTFFDREPRLDITSPGEEHTGRYDFLIASEIFEHVQPPVERAFEAAHRLLKSSGVLILTVPYSLEQSTLEHYPDLHRFGFAQVDGHAVLVNRTRAGEFQLFDRPVFHIGCGGPALEMREFSEADLKKMLAEAGFGEVRVFSADDPSIGILCAESWSLPIVARKGAFAFSPEAARDMAGEWQALRQRFDKFAKSYWFRLGSKLGLY